MPMQAKGLKLWLEVPLVLLCATVGLLDVFQLSCRFAYSDVCQRCCPRFVHHKKEGIVFTLLSFVAYLVNGLNCAHCVS